MTVIENDKKGYKNRWIEFIIDPKTIIVFIPFIFSALFVSISWFLAIKEIDLNRLKKILDHVELVDEDTIIFKSKANIAFASGIDMKFYYVMQTDGNFVVYEGDPKNRKIIFKTK